MLFAAHNYRLHGLNPYLLTTSMDVRSGMGKIRSRIGIEAEAHTYATGENLYEKIWTAFGDKPIVAVLVDEAQFLSRENVWELSDVADNLGVPVFCYGLRSDFRGDLFPGSAALMGIADEMQEITGICASGEKANMVARIGSDGCAIINGPQVLVGGEESYVAMSRRAWKRAVNLSIAKADEAPVRKLHAA